MNESTSPIVDPIRSACVLIERDGYFAVVFSEKHDGRPELPGGKCKPGETEEQAVRREALEEIGVELLAVETLIVTQEHPPSGGVHQCLSFIGHIAPDAVLRGSAEGEAGWMTRHELKERSSYAASLPVLFRAYDAHRNAGCRMRDRIVEFIGRKATLASIVYSQLAAKRRPDSRMHSREQRLLLDMHARTAVERDLQEIGAVVSLFTPDEGPTVSERALASLSNELRPVGGPALERWALEDLAHVRGLSHNGVGVSPQLMAGPREARFYSYDNDAMLAFPGLSQGAHEGGSYEGAIRNLLEAALAAEPTKTPG